MCSSLANPDWQQLGASTRGIVVVYQRANLVKRAVSKLHKEAVSVSRAALEVGYASPTQFSREFSRRFGMTPRTAKNLGPEPVAVVA